MKRENKQKQLERWRSTPWNTCGGHLKNHEVANLCAESFGPLTEFARRRLKSLQRRPALVRAFWQQPELPLVKTFSIYEMLNKCFFAELL